LVFCNLYVKIVNLTHECGFKDILNQILQIMGFDHTNETIRQKIFLLHYSNAVFENYQIKLEKVKDYQTGCYYKVVESKIGQVFGTGWVPNIMSKHFDRFPETLYMKLEETKNKIIVN
ncbi:MAG: hypothetical protein ACOCUI_01225, partial [bacterium]